MKKHYLVTGGTGFIGAALVKRLVKLGYRVRVLDNQARGKLVRLKEFEKDFEFMQGDIRDFQTVRKAVKGIDAVCHLAFINGTEFFYKLPELVLEVGVKGIVNVIDACLEERVGELLLASSSEVYQSPPYIPTDEKVQLSIPDPLNPRYSYAAGKIISEMMAINYGRKKLDKVVIFRPHNVYGPDMGYEHVMPQFILRMKKICQTTKSKKIRFPIQGTGRETRSFVFIEDFIAGLMLLTDKGKHLNIYNIGTEEEVAIKDLAAQIGKYFGRQVEIIGTKSPEGSTKRRCPDISKIIRLGYKPKFNLAKGISIVASWYEEHEN